jgi:hypothetical protein
MARLFLSYSNSYISDGNIYEYLSFWLINVSTSNLINVFASLRISRVSSLFRKVEFYGRFMTFLPALVLLLETISSSRTLQVVNMYSKTPWMSYSNIL